MEEQLPTEPEQPEPEPKIIGLTGGIGSGKSTVAAFIENKGYPIYYSDLRAKEIVNENLELKSKIIKILGENAYDENGLYNRKYVSEKVFNNEELLHQLNTTIHPEVRKDFEHWIQQQKTTFIFKETALLFELKLNLECDKSLLVTADDHLRMKRVMDRDGKTYRQVEAIMKNQMPEKDKCKIADYVICNNTNLQDLQQETLVTIEQIKKDFDSE